MLFGNLKSLHSITLLQADVYVFLVTDTVRLLDDAKYLFQIGLLNKNEHNPTNIWRFSI